MDFPFFASPNFTSGRKKEIKAIIIHRTFGSLEKTVQRCFDPGFWESFHFLVSRQGKIIQLVKCQDTAWHCGWISNPKAPNFLKPNPNFCSIGIACEDYRGKKSMADDENFWTGDQENALAELIEYLRKNLNIPADSYHILGHSKIDPQRSPQDPGPFLNWKKILPADSHFPQKKKSQDSLQQLTNSYLLEGMIEKLFYGILNREPNTSELDYYRHSGLDIAQISGQLARTEEFKKKLLNQY
ncbi:MAG: peptidoglycan recognition family protein [Patescibacteria group bacterium]|nr:peptidoglycan recognition family protein [Patescibacteria group bacterium]